jgi:hypothetical protein
MATNAATQWNHAVPLGHTQYENERPRAASASRGGNYTYNDSSYAYGSVGKRPSNNNMRGDNEGQRSRKRAGYIVTSSEKSRSKRWSKLVCAFVSHAGLVVLDLEQVNDQPVDQ